MTDPLKIVVADDEPEMREYLQETISLLGHEVIGAAATGRELLICCRDSPPDLVITDIKMPDMDGIQAANELRNIRPLPVILVSAYHEPELIERALNDHVLAFLVKPIKQADLETAIALAVRRFQEFCALQQQADDLRQALEDRKLVERAKGILMKRAAMSEADAFRRLQRLASDKNTKMVEIARTIVVAEEAFGG
ncbi:ANTAR domain-containing response regulator [Thalassoroseus pseudoceratinae]|uniref:ANTAR domain-containing response regulator n=1 Tax=Thalassoroseus pseudoceratinae TaxID=2713176 RepID=UPI0014238E38|nr:response regulator [Thalassoroseus pseudoceratinae]